MSTLKEPVSEKDHIRGSFEAPVTLVEYGDYECRRCKLASPIMIQLGQELGDNLRYVFRHFPLKKSHPHAIAYAQAAEAAGMQNHFWEMHELIYRNQAGLTPEALPLLAKELNLDLDQFEKDRLSADVNAKIENDFNKGVRSDVNGTPCFYINGSRYDGDSSYDGLLKALRGI